MTQTSPLPAVQFDRLGKIDAAHAVRVNAEGYPDSPDVTNTIQADDERTFSVSVMHPTGGRIYVEHNVPARLAILVRDQVQDVLAAWATFTAEEAS